MLRMLWLVCNIYYMLHTNHSMRSEWNMRCGLMFWSTIAVLLEAVVIERVVQRTWIIGLKRTQWKIS